MVKPIAIALCSNLGPNSNLPLWWEDFTDVGYLALVEAAKKIDPSRTEGEIRGYLGKAIKNAIWNAICAYQRFGIVDAPERKRLPIGFLDAQAARDARKMEVAESEAAANAEGDSTVDSADLVGSTGSTGSTGSGSRSAHPENFPAWYTKWLWKSGEEDSVSNRAEAEDIWQSRTEARHKRGLQMPLPPPPDKAERSLNETRLTMKSLVRLLPQGPCREVFVLLLNDPELTNREIAFHLTAMFYKTFSGSDVVKLRCRGRITLEKAGVNGSRRMVPSKNGNAK